MLYRENLKLWDIEDLRTLKVELHWALQEKENEDKITLFGVEEYTGVNNYFINFENALKYVMTKTESAYREGLEQYNSEGRPSYITFKGYGPRIITKLVAPCDVKSYFPTDMQEV